jgi:hypothetical protein
VTTPADNAVSVSTHVETLDSGRSIAPDERFVLSVEEQQSDGNARLIRERKILIDPDVKAPESEAGGLAGKALERRAKELNIEGYSTMSADDLRAAVADAEEKEKEGNQT